MDDADRASIEIEREQDRLTANALARASRVLSEHDACEDCGEPLSAVRREYGTCIQCASAREARARQHGGRYA